jgi:hypothetical protein
MTDRRDKAELVEVPPAALEREVEPPVVARLIVEIRSDGSRTIARGAVEDTASGQRTTIEARGDSPLQLALALARSLTQMPRALFSRPPSPDARPGLRGLRGLLGRRRRG